MDSQKKKKNKHKKSTREELREMGKEDLINKIMKLEAQNVQLQQLLKKALSADANAPSDSNFRQKAFDFSKSEKRHIFLKFYYLGWNHDGFVIQEDTQNTIEDHLFSALTKICAIESRETSNYHRCGRTDKGVSAFSQVVSLTVRSRLAPERQNNLDEEMSYCKLLNRLLPKSIRCIAWSPQDFDKSARFDCKFRTYKYFFPRGSLNIEAMDRAAKHLIGSHDFRNLCKMDVENGVMDFHRTIVDAKVVCDEEKDGELSAFDMCSLTIKSHAFLWHQIRCIMGVLLLIGQEHEKPEVILDLLDIERCPERPQYIMAHELPLNLFHCDYENVDWYVDEENLRSIVKDLQEDWTMHSIKSAMIKCMLDNLSSTSGDVPFQGDCLLQGTKTKIYQPLKDRIKCKSLESRIENYTKKQKLDTKTREMTNYELSS